VKRIVLKGRGLVSGMVEGECLVSNKAFGFWGEYDPMRGIVTDARHDWYGKKIAKKILVFPLARGSTGGAGVFLESVRRKNYPLAIVVKEAETILITGPMLAKEFYNIDIPVVDRLNRDPTNVIKTGDWVKVDGEKGMVEIVQKSLRESRP